MLEKTRKEISELHAFFEAWYRGVINNSDSVFHRLSDVLAPEYMLITSDGHVLDREQVLSFLRSAYAAKPDIDICAKNIQLRIESGEILLITYEEHGTTENKTRATLISAILRKNPVKPNDVEWLHIHEVRLP